jgi:hypothetical protein
MSESAESVPASRPRLTLKPRDESAAKQLELQRTASGKVSRADHLCRAVRSELDALAWTDALAVP